MAVQEEQTGEPADEVQVLTGEDDSPDGGSGTDEDNSPDGGSGTDEGGSSKEPDEEELIKVVFVWAEEITTVVPVEPGASVEALTLNDLPEGEALDEYRTGYELAWYTDSSLNEKFDFTETISEPLTLYAGYIQLNTVTFVWAKDKTTVVEVKPDALVEEPTLDDLPEDLDYYRTGYELAWYTDESLTEKFDFTEEITEPLTLYAGYTQLNTVTFVWAEGITTVVYVKPDTLVEALTLDDLPEALDDYRTGYKLTWYTNESLNETFNFDKAITESLTLYANYTQIKMEVTFVWAEGITTVVKVEPGRPVKALTLSNLPEDEALDEYRTGYELTWYTDEDLTEQFDFTQAITESLTLYAGYTHLYSVTYIWDCGETEEGEESSVVTLTIVHEGELVKELALSDAPEGIQAVYDCRYQLSWYADEEQTEPYDFASPVEADVILYAGYEILPNMAWFADTTKTEYTLTTVEELQSLSVLTEAGYDFQGVTIYLGYTRDVEDAGDPENAETGETETGETETGETETGETETGETETGETETGEAETGEAETGEPTEPVERKFDLSGVDWTPIGTPEHPFAGTFDGGVYDDAGELVESYTFNLYIYNKTFQYAGLFGYVTGAIRNVTVTGMVYVTADYAGSLAGRMKGEISNCVNQSRVVNMAMNGVTGGIVGSAVGSITNTVNTGAVSGTGSALGGIVGTLELGGALVRNCINEGRVASSSTNADVGGIVGLMRTGARIQFCGNSNTVAATLSLSAGGIAGRLIGTSNPEGDIISCFNSGDVLCKTNCGGILGYSPQNRKLVQCCVLIPPPSKDYVWQDTAYVTGPLDPAEGAYFLDNGGSEDRYLEWGWAEGDETPVLVSQGAQPVYKVTMVPSGSYTLTLSQEYPIAGDTVTVSAKKTDTEDELDEKNELDEGEKWCIECDEVTPELWTTVGKQTSFTMPERDVTVYVTIIMEGSQYTVTFLDNVNGEVYASQTVDGGARFSRPEDPTKPAEDGQGYYVFLGWYRCDENGEPADEPYDFRSLAGEDITLCAKWGTVTVQFDLNGVLCKAEVPESYETMAGVSLAWPEPEPIAINKLYGLLGWSTDPQDDGKTLWVFDNENAMDGTEEEEAPVPTLVPAEAENTTLTLYAIWVNTEPVPTWARVYEVAGAGTEAEPYLIESDAQLEGLADMMYTYDETMSGYYFRLSPDGEAGGQFKPKRTLAGHPSPVYYVDDGYVTDIITYYAYTPFEGVFDGNKDAGCTVDISLTQIGLFGTIGANGVVRDLAVTGSLDTSAYQSLTGLYFLAVYENNDIVQGTTGAVACIDKGLIDNCSFTGTITDTPRSGTEKCVGGIVGAVTNDGVVQNCSAVNASITAKSTGAYNGTTYDCGAAGGIAGYLCDNGSVFNCTAENTAVVAGVSAGGIVGRVGDLDSYYELDNPSRTISGCAVTGENGSVTAGCMVGGIAGYAARVNVYSCTNQVPVTANGGYYRYLSAVYHVNYAGGIVSNAVNCNLTKCTNAGPVCGDGIVGGIVPYLTAFCGGNISGCENSGEITSTTGTAAGIAGGIFHYDPTPYLATTMGTPLSSFSISDCINSGNIIVNAERAVTNVAGIVGYITDRRSGEYSVYWINSRIDFNISGCEQKGSIFITSEQGSVSNVGGILGGVTYANYMGESYAPKANITNSSVSGSIQIKAATISYIGGVSGAQYKLELLKDVTLSGVKLTVDGNGSYIGGVAAVSSIPYSGVTVDGVEIEVTGTGKYVGGVAGQMSGVENLNYDGISVTVAKTGSWIGGVAGSLSGSKTLTGSVSNISVTVWDSANNVGGIAGSLANSGEVELTVSDVPVTVLGRGDWIGGVTGQLSGGGTVRCVVENGAVTVSGNGSYVGGITGQLGGSLTHCGYTGSVTVSQAAEEAVGGLVGSGNTKESFYLGELTIGNVMPGCAGLIAGDGNVESSYFYGDYGGPTVLTGAGRVAGSYYLGNADNGASKTAEQFSSGEVAWLMETMGGTQTDDHEMVWTQGEEAPEWSEGMATVYRVRADTAPTEGGNILLNGSEGPVYAATGSKVTAEVSVSTETTVEETEEGTQTVSYVLQKLSAVDDNTGNELQSSESGTTITFIPKGDSTVVAQFTSQPEKEPDPEPDPVPEPESGEGEGKGNDEGDGEGDDPVEGEGNGGFGDSDGYGFGGTDTENHGTVVPTVDGEYPVDMVVSVDSSETVQVQETVGEPSSSGGETVEEPAPEPEYEPEPEPEVEPEVEPQPVVYELVPNLIAVIKDNPLLTALVGLIVVCICVIGGVAQYRAYKRRFS